MQYERSVWSSLATRRPRPIRRDAMSDIPYPTPVTSTWRRKAYAQVAQERIDADKVDRTDVALIGDLFRKPFRYIAVRSEHGYTWSRIPLAHVWIVAHSSAAV